MDNLESPFLISLTKEVRKKSKGIKHRFANWSMVRITDSEGEGLEFKFKLLKEKPSRVCIDVWDCQQITIDMRTYAKHDGWEFEHRIEGVLSENKFEEFINLIKNLSLYFNDRSKKQVEYLVANLK